MTRITPEQRSFSSGEVDPLLVTRTDYQRAQTGLAKCRGFLPLPQGGVTRAPGTEYLGNTRSNAAGVLIPFQFAANDALALEFTPGKMRVWRYGALVLTSGGAVYELTTPYDAEAIQRLKWAQSADVIYLVDGVLPMQKLSRYALNNWTIAAVDLKTGPFNVQNLTESQTLTASAETGTITLTASWSYFTASMVGALIKLQPTDNTAELLWTSNEVVAVGQRRRYGENIYQLVTRSGADVGQNPPIHSEGTVRTDNTTTWKFVGDATGIVKITAVASGTSATATVLRRVPKACVSDATYRWSLGAWNAVNGYPAAIEIFDQRLIAAATPSEPRTVWFSAVGDYSDFGDGTEDDEPFAYTIAGSGSVNRIQDLRRARSGLVILALGEEYALRPESRTTTIGVKNCVFELIGNIGSNGARPIAPDGDPIYITRDEGRLMQLAYNLSSDDVRASNLSRPAQHIGLDRFQQVEWQSAPEPTAWLRLGNGSLAALIYDRAEEVLGWAVIPVAGGAVESIAVVPDITGVQDTILLIVARQIGGSTQRFVEQVSPIFGRLASDVTDIAEANHYFAAKRFVATAAFSSVSVPHLAGQSVHVWTDEGCFMDLTVGAAGELSFPASVTSATVGLFDNGHFIETLPVQGATPSGSAMGRYLRIKRLALALHKTAQGFVRLVSASLPAAPIVSPPKQIVNQSVGADLTDLYSGIAPISIECNSARECRVRITPFSGAPLTVLSITPTVEDKGE